MNQILRRFKLTSFLRHVFVVLIVVNIVIGTDLALTTIGFASTSPDNLMPVSRWGFTSAFNLEIEVHLDIPNWGFVPKEVLVSLKTTLGNTANSLTVRNDQRNVPFGQPLILLLQYRLTLDQANDRQGDGFLLYNILIGFLPIIVGIEIHSAFRTLTITGVLG